MGNSSNANRDHNIFSNVLFSRSWGIWICYKFEYPIICIVYGKQIIIIIIIIIISNNK